ncbi:hypothetical protein ACHAWF_001103 [Thalassiosira exigua]
MLAPRKKLWSSPPPAVDVALDFADLGADDVVYDVGCGDGRVLIRMAAAAERGPEPERGRAGSPSGSSGEDDEPSRGDPPPDSAPHSPSSPPRRRHRCRRFVGVEIDPVRAEEARRNVLAARRAGDVPPHVDVEIVCANALDATAADYAEATVVFLYLVPRGLRLIKDLVWPKREGGASCDGGSSPPEGKKRPRRIVTYMAPFEGVPYARRGHCEVEHQEGARWPVYLYHADV